jgi:hypothetical protein
VYGGESKQVLSVPIFITDMGINVNTLRFFACVCTFVALLIALAVGSHGSLSLLFVMKVMV